MMSEKRNGMYSYKTIFFATVLPILFWQTVSAQPETQAGEKELEFIEKKILESLRSTVKSRLSLQLDDFKRNSHISQEIFRNAQAAIDREVNDAFSELPSSVERILKRYSEKIVNAEFFEINGEVFRFPKIDKSKKIEFIPIRIETDGTQFYFYDIRQPGQPSQPVYAKLFKSWSKRKESKLWKKICQDNEEVLSRQVTLEKERQHNAAVDAAVSIFKFELNLDQAQTEKMKSFVKDKIKFDSSRQGVYSIIASYGSDKLFEKAPDFLRESQRKKWQALKKSRRVVRR